MLSFKASLFRLSGLTKVALGWTLSDTEMEMNTPGMGTPEPTRVPQNSLSTSTRRRSSWLTDDNPDELLDVLMEGQSSVYVWAQLANEYIFRDLLESVESVLRTGERRRSPRRSLRSFANKALSTRRIY